MADKQLHNLTITTTLSDSDRIAAGDGTTSDKNITWLSIKSLLYSSLGFLKSSNYLSEYLGNSSAQLSARTNIGAVGTSDIINLATKSSVILKSTPSQTFVPSIDSDPVNKAYADSLISTKIIATGTYAWSGDIDTWEEKTISLPATNGTTSYCVLITPTAKIDPGILSFAVGTKSISSFTVWAMASPSWTQGFTFDYVVISI